MYRRLEVSDPGLSNIQFFVGRASGHPVDRLVRHRAAWPVVALSYLLRQAVTNGGLFWPRLAFTMALDLPFGKSRRFFWRQGMTSESNHC